MNSSHGDIVGRSLAVPSIHKKRSEIYLTLKRDLVVRRFHGEKDWSVRPVSCVLSISLPEVEPTVALAGLWPVPAYHST